MKPFLMLLGCLLAIVLTAAGVRMDPITARRAATLEKAGFPADYALALAILQQRHPNWRFEPLPVSDMQPKYTWDHVLHMETDDAPRRSLISGGDAYGAYFHETDQTLYDAGCRRASRAAVAYFMDPRNFLNERDIFQFLDLRSTASLHERTVAAALRNTFMAAEKLENGRTIARYLMEVGRELDVNPVFLASRMRQEQGLRGTPLVSGQCGTLLARYYREKTQMEGRFTVLTPAAGHTEEELRAFDGLYNFFNIEAAGSGRFRIYLGGMREARRGTPAMARRWGGPQWDTKWKAIYGGAAKIAASFIGNYQNTLYLQKWNVDPRSRTAKGNSRNFWGQYMQNIGAAFSEGRNMQTAFARLEMLKLPFTFLIPVYSGMPETASPDPADGACRYYRAHRP